MPERVDTIEDGGAVGAAASDSVIGRTFSSLRVRNYRYYFAGQSLSMIGTWMQSIAQSWLVWSWTHSGFKVGLLVALQTLPILVLGPLGGTLADRFGKYRMLFYTQAFSGLQALAIAVLDLTGHLQLWQLYLAALALGFINMVDNPTRQTFIVEMVGRDELPNAVTLNSVMVNVARAVGPAVAGLLIATVGTGWCFLINGLSFGFVLASLRAIRAEELTPAPRAPRLRGQLREGFRYVGHTPMLRDVLIMMALIGCLTYEFQTTLPLMTGSTFHGDSRDYGYLTACMGAGAVIGGLIAAGRKRGGPHRLVTTAAVFGLAVLAAALAPSLLTEGALLLLVGACSVTFLALGNSTLQLQADPAMRGRVMSLWSVAFLGSTPIGGPLVGFIGGHLGARYGLAIGGLAALTAALYGWIALKPRPARTAVDEGLGSPALATAGSRAE
ncbi:MAG TPA: MFS transporter [Acidimicrobiales bacterium]|nr:MFS transporter [Acidimicrobiales bacterium]